jgi:CheY-like chemotaxis protein
VNLLSTSAPGPGVQVRPRVVIADPDTYLAASLGDALAAAGYSASAVPTAQALWDAVRRRPVQLVVLATDFPETTATETLARLRQVCAAPPVVLLAPRGGDPHHAPPRDAVAACVFKPVDTDALVGVCRRVLWLSDQKTLRERRRQPRRRLHLDVTVEAPGGPLAGSLVSLSAGGFCLELKQAVPSGSWLNVAVASPGSHRLMFCGRVEWQKAVRRGTITGGPIMSVSAEDERILTALLDPLG